MRTKWEEVHELFASSFRSPPMPGRPHAWPASDADADRCVARSAGATPDRPSLANIDPVPAEFSSEGREIEIRAMVAIAAVAGDGVAAIDQIAKGFEGNAACHWTRITRQSGRKSGSRIFGFWVAELAHRSSENEKMTARH